MKKRLRKKLEKQHEARKKAILEFYAFMEWFTKTAGEYLGESNENDNAGRSRKA